MYWTDPNNIGENGNAMVAVACGRYMFFGENHEMIKLFSLKK